MDGHETCMYMDANLSTVNLALNNHGSHNNTVKLVEAAVEFIQKLANIYGKAWTVGVISIPDISTLSCMAAVLKTFFPVNTMMKEKPASLAANIKGNLTYKTSNILRQQLLQ